MERPSASSEQLAEVRIELNDLAKDQEWRHRVVMAEFADLHEEISRRPSQSWLTPDMIAKLPIILAVALPVLVYLLTGSADKAMQANAIIPR